MKRIINILALVLAVFAVMSVFMGCNNPNGENGENDNNEPVYKDYSVKVIDGLGRPVGNVMINFINSNGEKKSRVTDKDGVAFYKNAPAGDYKVVVEQGLSDVVILQSEYKLTKDITSVRILVRDENNTMSIYGEVPEDCYAYGIGVGSYNVVCDAGKTSYLIFNAPQSGIYKVSFESDDNGMTIGHYGIPMFVQVTHCGDLDYDGKTFELVVKDHSTPYVLGVNATKDCIASLNVERIGNAPFDPTYDAEWVEVQSTATLFKPDLKDKTVVDLDIASNDLSVSLGDDGYYYTNNGKLVYVRITSVTGHGRTEGLNFIPVLGGSLALIAGHVDQNTANNIGGYVYDAEGNFLNKYRYNEMIKTYMNYSDPVYGVAPLTAEMAECIKLHGEFHNWWNPENPSYLFDGVEVNLENAWLFLCVVEA